MTTATNFRENETASFAAVIAATASKKGIELQVPPPVVPPVAPAASKASCDSTTSLFMDTISSMERVCMLLRYMNGRLAEENNPLAEVAWTAFLDGALACDKLGEAIGVETSVSVN